MAATVLVVVLLASVAVQGTPPPSLWQALDVVAPTTVPGLCGDHGLAYLEAALNRTPWAARMFDASSKIPGGVLVGNTVSLGNFDECVLQKSDMGFSGKYCLAKVTMAVTMTKPGLSDQDHRHLRWGVCVPDSCSPSDVSAHLRSTLPFYMGIVPEEVMVDVGSLECSTSQGIPMSFADWIFVGILLLFGGALVASTVYDVFVFEPTEGRKDSAYLAFSVRKNWRFLTATSQSGLTSLHGIKFLSMVWVVLFHKYAVMTETPAINKDSVEYGLKYDLTQMPISNGGTLAVDTFFVVSGLLLAFVFLRDRKAGRPFNIISFYAYRYVRLTPIYATVIGLYATISSHLGSGPLWKETMIPYRDNCRTSWWWNLLYINNYQSPASDVCMAQSWYLATDTQLFWLSPVVLYPMWRWPRFGRYLLGGLFTIPLIVPFILTYVKNYPWADVRNLSDEVRNEFLPLMYAATYSRAAPFLIGVALGWFLFYNRTKEYHLSKWIVCTAWILSTIVALTVVYSIHVYYNKDYSPSEAAFFASLHPFGWSLVVAWVIFACEKGYAGPVRSILCWPGFQPLGKLCYSAYLIHFLVFYYDLAVIRAPISYDHFNTVHTVLGDMAIILILSAVLALTFEFPVLNLDKVLLKPESTVKTPAMPTTSPNVLFSKPGDNLSYIHTEQPREITLDIDKQQTEIVPREYNNNNKE